MKKSTLLLIVLAVLAAVLLVVFVLLPALQPAPQEEEKVLNIFTWESYVDQDTVLTPFTEETGIKVNYSTFSTNEEMLTKLQASGGADYDLILASDYMLDAARQEGLIQPLNKELIPNFQNIKESCLNQYFDPESAYVVPYVMGSPVIVYDPALVDIEITGYEDLWDPALADSVVVMDDARNVVGMTLKTLGHSLNETDPEILNQAAEKLAGLRGNIRAFDYDTPHVLMTSGETTVGYMFTPFAALARMDRPDLEVVFPKEGLGFGIDGFAIPVKAPHPENANLFLDFVLRPEIGAQVASVQLYNNINKASEELLPEIFLSDPALNVPEEMLKDAEFVRFLGADEAKFQDIWLTFKQQ